MERKMVSTRQHEIADLARKHGASIEEVERIIRETGSRSREQIQAALDKHLRQRAATGTAGSG